MLILTKFTCLERKALYNPDPSGGVSEWPKELVLKTSVREYPGFESLPHRHFFDSKSAHLSRLLFIQQD